MEKIFKNIYLNRKVLVTGHTGFKGSWLCLLLNELGANVSGFALDPPTEPSLYNLAEIDDIVQSYIGDIRDAESIKNVILMEKPEIIIHMAAQPIVRDSYKYPVETFSTNVMGVVNLFEACRAERSVKAIVNVTTDKCYENREWHWGYRENEAMGGYDPYSSSKGCSELVTSAYRNSFFNAQDYAEHGVAIASARAGNVIGGGDWAADRLVPDFIRAIISEKKLRIRSPYAIRPWQFVLEPLNGYLSLAAKLFSEGPRFSGAWNFGPDDQDAKTVEWIAAELCALWGENAEFEIDDEPQPHEAHYLKLDCSKAKAELLWTPKWKLETNLEAIVQWNRAWQSGDDIRVITTQQIKQFFS
jgi:CDP-glucose 4,6-dehydratase